jgi:hypothetical protein
MYKKMNRASEPWKCIIFVKCKCFVFFFFPGCVLDESELFSKSYKLCSKLETFTVTMFADLK